MHLLSVLKVVGGVGASILVVAVVVGGYAFLVNKQQRLTAEIVAQGMSATAQELVTLSQLDRAVLSLQFSEEVVAQSVRTYAASQEAVVRSRYELMHPQLVRAIEELRAASQGNESSALSEVVRSSERLAVISTGAMALVNEGRTADAAAALDGSQYTNEKIIFERSLRGYTDSRDRQTAGLLQTYENARIQAQEMIREIMYVSGALAILLVLATVFTIGAVLQLRKSAWARLATTLHQMVSGGVIKPLEVPVEKDTKSVAEHVNVLANAVVNSRGKSQALLQAAQEPLLVVNDDGTVHAANAAALKIFGVSRQELVGKSLDDVGVLRERASAPVHYRNPV